MAHEYPDRHPPGSHCEQFEVPATDLQRKAREMRDAIDMIEGALMGLDTFVDLPDIFDGVPDDVIVAPKMTMAEVRRVCRALSECTRIINDPEFGDLS